jgi:TPR repeat protein
MNRINKELKITASREAVLKAAKQDDAIAQSKLGYHYINGIGISKNTELAVSWFKKSAEQGFVEAQYNLGTCYEEGKGINVNIQQAKYWYGKAAEQGFEVARQRYNALENKPDNKQNGYYEKESSTVINKW